MDLITRHSTTDSIDQSVPSFTNVGTILVSILRYIRKDAIGTGKNGTSMLFVVLFLVMDVTAFHKTNSRSLFFLPFPIDRKLTLFWQFLESMSIASYFCYILEEDDRLTILSTITEETNLIIGIEPNSSPKQTRL